MHIDIKTVMCIHALHYTVISILHIVFLFKRYGNSSRFNEFSLMKIKSQHNYVGRGDCKVEVAARDYTGRYPLPLPRPRTKQTSR